jgi:hypothetical protein
MLKNPFIVYVATFATALAIYQLGWTDIYPPLSVDTLFFFGATFFSALLLATFVSPAIRAIDQYRPGLLPRYFGIFIGATFLAEVALSGGVPLILIFGGAKFASLESTATHLHLFVFWSVYSTIRFADFVYSRRVIYLLEASLPVMFFVLFVYRGPAIICLLSWVFVSVIRHGGFKLKHLILLFGAGMLALLVNGLLGNVRSPGKETMGSPSAAFRSSGVPQPFFWSYLYVTVPIANLQLSVDQLKEPQGTVEEFFASELLPDTISKRILPMLNPHITSGDGNLMSRDQLYSWDKPQIAQGLNTSSIFGRAYGFFGWVGPTIMFVFLSAFIIFYLVLISRSPYAVPSLALLNTLIALCLINNMVASAAMLPLLVVSVLLPPWRKAKMEVCESEAK